MPLDVRDTKLYTNFILCLYISLRVLMSYLLLYIF